MLAIGAGAFFFLTKEEPPPPPKPRPVAQVPKQVAPQPTAQPPATGPQPAAPTTGFGKAVAKAKDVAGKTAQDQTAATNEVLDADAAKPGVTPPASTPPVSPAATSPASAPATNNSAVTTPAVASVEPAPTVAKPAAPPPPSVAFKAWVQNLKISGVRGGATPRVFIERTAYAPGDLVNPQLGVYFETYNAETRMLVFKDKSGATVERRN